MYVSVCCLHCIINDNNNTHIGLYIHVQDKPGKHRSRYIQRKKLRTSANVTADHCVMVVSAHVMLTITTGGRLPLLIARTAITFQALMHYHPLSSTKLYCSSLLGNRGSCAQVACWVPYSAAEWVTLKPMTSQSRLECSNKGLVGKTSRQFYPG